MPVCVCVKKIKVRSLENGVGQKSKLTGRIGY